MRPAALRRGASWNATWRALGGAVSTVKPATSSSARRPGLRTVPSPRRPCATRMRFSPVSGTTSATVAIAASLRNDSATRRTFSAGQPMCGKQRLDQLERHTGAAQILFQVRAIRAIGIEHRERGRQVRLGQVMVRDDDVDAQFVGAAHDFGGADAGIHADDQLHALFGGGLHYFGTHAVAVLQAVRHVIGGDAAGQFEGLGKQHDAGSAIHVVIAVDQDALALADGARDALDSGRHVAQGHRIVQFFEGRMQEPAGCRGVGESAVYEYFGGRRSDLQGGRQSGDNLRVGRGQHPARGRTNSWRNTRQAGRLRPNRPLPWRSRSRLPPPGIPRTSRAGVRRRRGWNCG